MLKTCLNCGVEFEGAAQARFHSNACRMAYKRRELAQAEPEGGQELELEQASEQELAQVLAEPVQRLSAAISEAEYVRRTVAEAALYADSIGEIDKPTKRGDNEFTNLRSDRLKRAEGYARWRYRGYLSGEVASL